MLYCAVGEEEYNKKSTCDTIKEMWYKLEVTYEETTKVNEARIREIVMNMSYSK